MPLQLSVDYYNEEEAKLFKAYDNYTVIDRMIQHNLVISEDEFKSYMLFTEQANENGFRTYQELKDRVQHRLGDIDDYLDLVGGTITTKKSSERLSNTGMTERIGVSLGLNVINKFHGLTEADWAITPNVYIGGKRMKDFDYQISMASDGSRFIQVENKGSIVDDNSYKRSTVSNHYSSIKGKKESILDREKALSIARHQNIYYGTIGVLDDCNIAKVWLVDPEAYNEIWDPKKYKLISRLVYYAKLLKEVGLHNNIQIALENRIDRLLSIEDYKSLNNIPLELKKGIPVNFLQSKYIVTINYTEAIGSFFLIESKNEIQQFVIATPKSLVNLIIAQDFEKILNYEYNNDEMNDKVTIGLETKLSQTLEEFDYSQLGFVLNEKRKRYYLQSYQPINHIKSGRIFGMVNSIHNVKHLRR